MSCDKWMSAYYLMPVVQHDAGHLLPDRLPTDNGLKLVTACWWLWENRVSQP